MKYQRMMAACVLALLGCLLARAQPAEQTTAKTTDYQRGVEALDSQRWQQAVEAFSQVVERNGGAGDGALYWKAYAENRLGDKAGALETIAKLRNTKPKSKWINDASALEVEVQSALGHPLSPGVDTDVNIRLLVLSNLMAAKPNVALPALQKILDSKSPFAVKDRALFVVAQSPTPEARRILGSTAQDLSDPALRANAIRYVGLMGGDDGGHIDHLVAMFGKESNAEVRDSILKALAMGNNAKALAQLARNENDPQRKAEIMRYLSLLRGAEAARYPVDLRIRK